MFLHSLLSLHWLLNLLAGLLLTPQLFLSFKFLCCYIYSGFSVSYPFFVLAADVVGNSEKKSLMGGRDLYCGFSSC